MDMSTSIDHHIVIPGDEIPEIQENAAANKKIILGNGIRYKIINQSIDNLVPVVTKPGALCKRKPNVYYVDSYQKRYAPAKNDTVLGIIQSRTNESFWVDINYSEPASLSYLAFEGATKKNRPELNVGDVVCCKVVVANSDLEPELVCVDSTGKKGNLGELKDGLMFPCSINLVRKLLNEKCRLLHMLSKESQFELVAGINGRIWLNAKSLKTCILLRDVILKAEHVSFEQMKDLVDDFGHELTGIK